MFLQPDWWEVTQSGVGTNRFSYSANDPINGSDPRGNRELSAWENFWSGGIGDWTPYDRTHNTERRDDVNTYNLQLDNGYEQYETVDQRAAFYQWFSTTESARGGEVRWPSAAARMASGVDRLLTVIFGAADDFLRDGNEMIFNDVFNDLHTLRNSEPLTGYAAWDWDSKILGDEQQLA